MTWQQVSGQRFVPGSVETLKFKLKSAVYRLRSAGSDGPAIIAKRCVATTAAVERLVYQEVLAHLPAPALRCLGFAMEPEGEFSWLFLEDAGGQEYLPTCAEHRALAGRWLGLVHRGARHANADTWLPDRGPGHYLSLLNSAQSSLAGQLHNPVLTADEAALLQAMTAQFDLAKAHWAELEHFFERQPRTLVHGDFVTKNLRLRNGSSDPALLAFDWEMAGWGVPATDLAQCVGQCASPDLEIYGAVRQRDFPQLDLRDIERLADYGKVLRLVDKIFWMTRSMVGESRLILIKPLRTFETYSRQLSTALWTLKWN